MASGTVSFSDVELDVPLEGVPCLVRALRSRILLEEVERVVIGRGDGGVRRDGGTLELQIPDERALTPRTTQRTRRRCGTRDGQGACRSTAGSSATRSISSRSASRAAGASADAVALDDRGPVLTRRSEHQRWSARDFTKRTTLAGAGITIAAYLPDGNDTEVTSGSDARTILWDVRRSTHTAATCRSPF